jgi:hypothetical protein
MLRPLSPLRKQARDGRLCWQGTILHSVVIVVGHYHPQCCHQCNWRSKQGMAKDAKAPLSVLPPPLSSRTVVCAADIVAIMQQGKERPTCQGTIIHAVTAFHHCASLDTPMNAKQCQGTFVRTATTLVGVPIVCAAAIVATTEKGKEWPTMPRHHCPLCRRLSALPPFSLSHEWAWDSQQ